MGFWLGTILFAAVFAVSLFMGQSFSSIAFRSSAAFVVFYFVGYGLEKVWEKLSAPFGSPTGTYGSGNKETSPDLPSPGKIDFTIGPADPFQKEE